MSPLQLIMAALAVAYVAGQFLQERRKLGLIEQMPGREAQAYYERTRRKYERLLLVFTILFCTAAAGALTYSYWAAPR